MIRLQTLPPSSARPFPSSLDRQRRGLLALAACATLGVHAHSQGFCFESRSAYPIGTNVTEIATGDLDGDGDLDLAASNLFGPFGGEFSVLLNLGGGVFGNRTPYFVGGNPNSVAIGDLDGDGHQDLVVMVYTPAPHGTLCVLRNQGNGTFAAPAFTFVTPNPRGVAIADLDGDGDLDVVAANDSNDASVCVFTNPGNGTLATYVKYATGRHPQAVAVADLDGDGDLDLATPNAADNNVSVLKNLGNGTFAPHVTYPAGSFPSYIAAEDFNGDGAPDLAVVSTTSDDMSVYVNLGNGTFAPRVVYPTESYAGRMATADFDLDGDIDIALGNMDEGLRLNQGNGTFSLPTNPPVFAYVNTMTAADLDGDGDSDLIGLSNTNPSVVILRNCASSGIVACAGDGSSTACPCGNNAPTGSGSGCLNSLGSGATLRGTGSASIVEDALVLAGLQMPSTSPALYYQGTNAIGGGAGTPFGDGLGCAGGTLIRLAIKHNTGGASLYPEASDPSVSTSGAVATPGERVYQVLYRDSASYCAAETLNFTNGWTVLWRP